MPGLKNSDRNDGKADCMVDSAARFVMMYLDGNTGAPAAADMYAKVGTFAAADSRANNIAAS